MTMRGLTMVTSTGDTQRDPGKNRGHVGAWGHVEVTKKDSLRI